VHLLLFAPSLGQGLQCCFVACFVVLVFSSLLTVSR
jgi:hypothetical protein